MHASVIPKYLTSDTIFKGFISYLCDFVFHSTHLCPVFSKCITLNILKLEISTFTVTSVTIWRHFPYHCQTPVHAFSYSRLHSKEYFMYGRLQIQWQPPKKLNDLI